MGRVPLWESELMTVAGSTGWCGLSANPPVAPAFLFIVHSMS